MGQLERNEKFQPEITRIHSGSLSDSYGSFDLILGLFDHKYLQISRMYWTFVSLMYYGAYRIALANEKTSKDWKHHQYKNVMHWEIGANLRVAYGWVPKVWKKLWSQFGEFFVEKSQENLTCPKQNCQFCLKLLRIAWLKAGIARSSISQSKGTKK